MIILYNPPSSPSRKPVLPMALLALGAVLEEDYEYEIVDGNVEDDPVRALEGAVRRADAEILGVTVMGGPQLHHAIPHCRQLKRTCPELTIVWGGYFPTQHHEICLRADYVDFVVRGHGEYVFKQFLDTWSSGGDPSTITGVAYRDSTAGEIVTNERAAIPNPDDLPWFPYHRVDVPRYLRSTFLGERTISHHSSYGCPFTCNFCAVVNMVDGAWLRQSAERTAKTTEYLVDRWQADAVEFYDNNFFVHEARTAAFAERVLGLDIQWWGESRIDTMMGYSDRTWELMRESGLKMVFMGAESGSDETLERMNKGGTASTEKTLAMAEKARKYDIVPEFSFVLGNPPEPEEDTYQTLEFIREVKQVNPDAEIILYMYTPVPLSGTLYDEAKALGFDFPETLEEWVRPEWKDYSQRRSSQVPWVEQTLQGHVRNFERVLNAYYPTSTDARLTGVYRRVLQWVGSWRWKYRIYDFPLELQVLQKLFSYQRPETSGF
jgi:radical SAM superfamily enzyme YgiQ (UPF0313 family)